MMQRPPQHGRRAAYAPSCHIDNRDELDREVGQLLGLDCREGSDSINIVRGAGIRLRMSHGLGRGVVGRVPGEESSERWTSRVAGSVEERQSSDARKREARAGQSGMAWRRRRASASEDAAGAGVSTVLRRQKSLHASMLRSTAVATKTAAASSTHLRLSVCPGLFGAGTGEGTKGVRAGPAMAQAKREGRPGAGSGSCGRELTSAGGLGRGMGGRKECDPHSSQGQKCQFTGSLTVGGWKRKRQQKAK
jgi:hypothetical protein